MTTTSPSESTYNRLRAELSEADEHQEQELARIRRMIGLFERIYGLTSDQMEHMVASGKMTETDDICQWKFYVDVIQHVSQA